MTDYSDEINKGRKVRAKIVVPHGEASKVLGSGYRLKPLDSHTQIDDGTIALLILPPKPLEIKGWVCDYYDPTCFCDAPCSHTKSKSEERNCRPVTLIEKEEK